MVWFWGVGGAGIRLTERISESLAARFGAEAVSISCHADNEWIDRLVRRGHPVSRISGPKGYNNKLALILSAVPRLFLFWQHLRRHRPDVVIIPINFALAWPLVLLPRWLFGAAIVYMIHDAQPHIGDFLPRLQRFTQRQLLRAADAGLAFSRFTASEVPLFYRHYPPLSVLPLSALVEPRRSEPRRRPEHAIRILFIGRLLAYKGLDMLAEAIERLSSRADWSLTIAGGGPEAASIRQMLGKFPQVDLSNLRILEESEIEALIDSHDVLICPYIEASQSGAIPEAFAAALPCIVTPVGALVEQLDDGRAGWVADAATAEALHAAILQAMDDVAGYEPRSDAALRLVGGVAAQAALESIVIEARRLRYPSRGGNGASTASR